VERTPIRELSGISQSAVLALQRAGIVTVGDLIKADANEVAYLVESYDDAETLLRLAQKLSKGKPEMNTQPEPPQKAAARPKPRQQAPKSAPAGPSALSEAMALVSAEDLFADDEARLGLACRLESVSVALREGTSEAEAVVALLQDAIVGPPCDLGRSAVLDRFGEEVGELFEECAQIQGVPVSPLGRASEVYRDRIQQASASARLVVTIHALSTVRAAMSLAQDEGDEVWQRFQGGREFVLWYYRSLGDALHEVDPNHLTERLCEGVEALEALGEQAPKTKRRAA
jgi:hypothetical protein